MPSKLKKAIGAVKDRTSISLAKVASNNTSNLDVAVLKATTHDDMPIEDRYVHEILHSVSSSKLYAAACARAIGKRIGRTRNWIVALKSLTLVLRIFQDGDPYFPREVLHGMKRGAKILNLSSFRDDSNSSPWDFTAFVRTFALYIDERLDCFLTGKLQSRYTHRVPEVSGRKIRRRNELVRDMKPAMLLDKVSYWQRLLERAIATRPTGAAKTNPLVQISFYAVVQESFYLYKDISDGLTLLLDSFFHLQYENCVSAFQTCVKASKQFEELSAFYSLCKSIGVGRTSEYPSIQTISEELIETLQEFLKDQSSFPTSSIKSENRLLLLHPPQNLISRPGRRDSYAAQTDFSVTTEEFSELNSENTSSHCTSLEDLISATEISTRSPSISIDLEAYPDQFEEQAQRDNILNRLSNCGSSQSLPISSPVSDLVSFDDWRMEEVEAKEHIKQELKQQPEQEKIEKQLNSSSNKGWEILLAKCVITPQHSVMPDPANTFSVFSEEEQVQLKIAGNGPLDPLRSAWEELAVNTMPSTHSTGSNYNMSSSDSFFKLDPLGSSSHHYNPFLHDTAELPTSTIAPLDFQIESLDADPNSFTSVPTFQASFPTTTSQATPTFSTQNPNCTTGTSEIKNDPFATFYNEQQLHSGSLDQQNLLHEQQLWLQNQNKIIAKHMV